MPIPIVTFTTPAGSYRCIDLRAAAGEALPRLPYVHRILLENVLRQDDPALAAAGRDAIFAWLETGRSDAEIPFSPTRILMHDTTCGPALTDIAAMRDALAEAAIRTCSTQRSRSRPRPTAPHRSTTSAHQTPPGAIWSASSSAMVSVTSS